MSGRKVVTPHFEILRRGEVIKVVPLHRSRLVIGSEGGADLRLKHPAIASRHLEVGVVQGRYLEARNLAGEGRVLLGGQPMDQARLREGDELDLGPVTLRLTYQRSTRAAGAAPNPEEDQPTDADVTAPTESDDTAGNDEATVDEPAPASASQSMVPPAGPTTGSRLGKRRRTPPGPRSGGMDLELDDIVLDPAPLVTIEPPGGKVQRVPLRVGSFVVGGGRCAFRLSYPGIAPAHAEMMVMPDGLVYLKHLAGGGQVTLRNGAPIQFGRWKSGDRVQVGPVTMQLQMVPQADLAAILARPVEPAPRKPSGALPRLDPAPMPPPRAKLVAAPRSSTLPESTVPDPLSGQPWVEPSRPHRTADPAPAAPVLRESPPPPQPLPPPPATEPPVAARPAPPTTPARPLVRVHRKTDPQAKKPRGRVLKQASSPLVHANPVQISLDVRASDTYLAHARGDTGTSLSDYEDDVLIDYQPAWWRRAGLPLLVGLLLLVIAGQYFMYQEDHRPTSNRSGGPQVASGETGVERDALTADNRDGGRLVVGDPSLRTPRAPTGGGDDWQPDVEGRFAAAEDASDHDSLAKLAAARADAAIRDESDAAESDDSLPNSSGGGAQGWVEMKEVEQVMWTNRKALAYCYTSAQEDDPGLQGILWLSLTLAADGRIRGAVVEPRSSIQNESLLKCLQRQLFRLDMPTPRGGSVTFSYPFELAR
jgi:hypothetical protein